MRKPALSLVGLLLAGCGPFSGASSTPTAQPAVGPAASSPSATSSSWTPSVTGTRMSAPAATTTPPRPATLQESFERVRSGVVRFEVSGCAGRWLGSGFQLSPDLVATVAHVVAGGQVIRVIEGTTSTAGTVIGVDQGTDVALVRTAVPLHGHHLAFADTPPRVGDQVAALGFPRGEPLGFSPGTVNGLGRKADIEGYLRHDLLEMDAATNPGSSGGPVIRADGAVVGLVDAGPNPNGPRAGDAGQRLAVSSATARSRIQGWTAEPQPQPAVDCTGAVDPDGNPVPPEDFPTREVVQAATTVTVYFTAVNGGDFPTALAQLTHPGSLQAFSDAVASTSDQDVRYRSVRSRGSQLVVWVTFTSHQSPGPRSRAGRPAGGDLHRLVPRLRHGAEERSVADRLHRRARGDGERSVRGDGVRDTDHRAGVTLGLTPGAPAPRSRHRPTGRSASLVSARTLG